AGIDTTSTAAQWYSTVSTEPVEAALAAEYWFRNLREPVRFAETVARMLADGVRYFVELSPHPALLTALEAIATEHGHDSVAVGSLRRDTDGARFLDRSLAQLYVGGLPLDWAKLTPAGDWADLPTYAWDEQSYWAEPARRGVGAGWDAIDHPLLDAVLAQPESGGASLTGRIAAASVPWLADH
ncbi:acyltransferase domain-containing protein, partial [Nocardia gipuzkoensis]